MSDPLKPTVSLLVKLGSIIVHFEEYTSEKGHAFDRSAIDSLLLDEEVHEWFLQCHNLGLLPVKRD